MRGVFMGMLDNNEKLLAGVENASVEIGYGFTGWIEHRRVLLGSREMMKRHDIEVPSLDYEKKYTKNDQRSPIYLAVAGKLFGMFLVSYRPDRRAAETLDSLAQSGISVLVQADDFNITAPLVAACAILKQMLEKRGVVIGTHLVQCAGVEDEPLAPGGEALARQLRALGAVTFPALSSVKAKAMQGAIEAAVEQVFDLRPAAIIEALGLKKPIYRALAAYGHMGREDLGVAWENTDKAAALKAALARA